MRHSTPLRSVLVPLPLSSPDPLIERVASLPLAPDARLAVLDVAPRIPALHRRHTHRDVGFGTSAAEKLADRIPTANITTIVVTGGSVSEIVAKARSMRAELIVMGRDEHPVRELVVGTTPARVIRKSKLPVLVARVPATQSYRCPLIALDIDHNAAQMIAFALRVLTVPRPPIALLHAYEAPFAGLSYPSMSNDAVIAYRESCRERASRELDQLLASVGVRDDVRWLRHLCFGNSRDIIPRTAAKLGCDLLVLGTHARTGLAHAMFGSIATDALRSVTCDVLIVPLAARA